VKCKTALLYCDMASPVFLPQPETIRRKPPTSQQFNWISGRYDVWPEQLDLDMPVPDEAILPGDSTVTLLATENGAQLLVAGLAFTSGRRRTNPGQERRQGFARRSRLCGHSKVIITSRGVSFSSDLLEELCARGTSAWAA
jgi:hypothetical protein